MPCLCLSLAVETVDQWTGTMATLTLASRGRYNIIPEDRSGIIKEHPPLYLGHTALGVSSSTFVPGVEIDLLQA